MLVTGELAAAEAGPAVLAVLGTETSDSVIEPYLTMAGDIAELWAPEKERAALAAAVAATCRDLAGQDGRRRVALRTFARVAAGPDELAWLRQQAGDDVDLRWRALARGAELGEPTAAEVTALLERDPDPDARLRALAVRAASPDAGEKEAVWQALAVDRSVPIGAIGSVAAAFWRPGQEDVLAPYAERYVAMLPGLHRGGMLLAMAFTGRLFPRFGVDEAFLDRAQEATADAVPVVRKTLLEKADLVRRMLRSRAEVRG
jgi:aminopeptidase N